MMFTALNEFDQSTMPSTKTKSPNIAVDLLDWYDRHARVLPWRVPPKQSKDGLRPDPYHIWLSEVMLQQTQVATVRDYYLKFLRYWPSIEDLAKAEPDDVMKAWAGLGYYSRARNLKKCAEMVAGQLNGNFPSRIDELKKLPGIGEYTSAAIASIAFGKPVPVVDGNIERVMTRLHRIDKPVREAKEIIKTLVADILPKDRPGDFAQSMMDLGATLCTPKNPACSLCPINQSCNAFAAGDMELYPVKVPKQERPTRKGAAFVIQNAKGQILLRKRADKGLLGGMSEVPGTVWTARIDGQTGLEALPFLGKWQHCGIARHSFTHFHLELEVWHLQDVSRAIDEGWWSDMDQLSGEALPTVMRKVIILALPDAFKGNS
ncbi:MAG: A/G-specific adenine glycosylase [Salaquimonas sp.]